MHGKVITIPEGHGFVMIDGRYYFGKTGAAYKADISSCGKHGAFVRKIGNNYYGFDYLGHMVTGTSRWKNFHVWSSAGVLF